VKIGVTQVKIGAGRIGCYGLGRRSAAESGAEGTRRPIWRGVGIAAHGDSVGAETLRSSLDWLTDMHLISAGGLGETEITK
jgi:hypothetical protein